MDARADIAAIAEGLTVDQYVDAIWARREHGRVTRSTGRWPILRAGEEYPEAKVDVRRLPAKLRRV